MMNTITCKHEYWKIGDQIKMSHSGEKGTIKLVERQDKLLVLTIDFYGKVRKVSSKLLRKI